MKYTLLLELKLQEVAEEPEPPMGADENPIAMMGGALKLMTGTIARPQFFMGNNAGFDFRKSIIVSAPHFAALAKIIEQYVSLTEQIEFSSETHGSTATHPAP